MCACAAHLNQRADIVMQIHTLYYCCVSVFEAEAEVQPHLRVVPGGNNMVMLANEALVFFFLFFFFFFFFFESDTTTKDTEESGKGQA